MEKENKYYVYLHVSLLTNTIFYVGKGTGKRAWCSKNRTSRWLTEANSGYTVQFLRENLSFTEAEDLEAALLNTPDPSWSLVNFVKSRIPSKLIEISDHVYYDISSPTFLRWKFSTVPSRRKLNGVAGSISKKGYSTVSINGKPYLAHRLIWVIFNKVEIPRGLVINHRDCNPRNNKIDNLEMVTFAVNGRKKKCHKLEFNGVNKTSTCPNKTTKYYSYTGTCTIDNKVINKSFSILKYGEAEAFRLACEWRKEQIRLLNEQGAGYTERHGT